MVLVPWWTPPALVRSSSMLLRGVSMAADGTFDGRTITYRGSMRATLLNLTLKIPLPGRFDMRASN